MTAYKCKLKKSRLESNIYLSRIEDPIFPLNIGDEHTKKSLGSAHKNRVGWVSGNKQLFLCLRQAIDFYMCHLFH